jgi:hypothetical protein
LPTGTGGGVMHLGARGVFGVLMALRVVWVA